MSSPQPFIPSSQSTVGTTGHHRKSRFAFRHLAQLGVSSPTCPLRVVAHVDLDAFYAQCEMVRLGLPEDQPLVVQQWQGIIAVNYPARKFGLNRHVTSAEAQKLCPNIIMQHVATWKEGEDEWAYREDAFKHISTHKVSLDPYRKESKKILETIKESLPPAPIQRVEKASIDEVFLDLSAQIHSVLLDRYPELQGPPPNDDPNERLPLPPTTALDWDMDELADLNEAENEDDDPDWDDVAMQIGSEIVRKVRSRIWTKLNYTCSSGLARNKMLAKLGSGHNKPNKQTVIRNRAVQRFLNDFKFTKIRMLGGKLGDEVVAMFQTDSVKELLDVPLEQLKRLGDDTGRWLYATIRGEDSSEVSSRTQIKSMLSAKSFRPPINSLEQAVRWLRIFVADIFSRCVEEGVLEYKRRPRTINLHHRQGAQTRSKQAPIPPGKALSEEVLLGLAKNLLVQIVAGGRAWPCANLSLSVAGFEDGETGNQGIGGFLVRGEEAKALQESERGHRRLDDGVISQPFGKKKKLDGGAIHRFFVGREGSKGESDYSCDEQLEDEESPDGSSARTEAADRGVIERSASRDRGLALPPADVPPPSGQLQDPLGFHQGIVATYSCHRCSTDIPEHRRAEHEDWHYAKDLSNELRMQDRNGVTGSAAIKAPLASKSSRRRGRTSGGAVKCKEKGQSRLAFGKG